MKAKSRDRAPHEREWQLQEAKNRLSQVVDSAMHEGPQTITLHGKPAAVVVAFDEYKKLMAPALPLSKFLRQSPLRDIDLDLTRSFEPAREVKL